MASTISCFILLPKFPGPKAAAFSKWYSTYWEVSSGVNWTDHLKTLHQKYGEQLHQEGSADADRWTGKIV
jgi:hypothetical protein